MLWRPAVDPASGAERVRVELRGRDTDLDPATIETDPASVERVIAAERTTCAHDGDIERLRAIGDTLGPGAFVVETALSPHARCEVEDLTTITSLTALAWCMELDVCERERPMPDLMMATAPEGVSLASIHHEPWVDALRQSLDVVMARMGEQPEGVASRSHAYVQMHLEGSSVEPWSLPDRPCVFATAMIDPHDKRVFVALSDTAENPNPRGRSPTWWRDATPERRSSSIVSDARSPAPAFVNWSSVVQRKPLHALRR